MPTPIALAPDHVVSLPASWRELTLRQAQRLAATPGHDAYGFIAALLGITRLDVMNLPAAGVEDILLPALAWATQPANLAELPLPETITLPAGGDDHGPVTVKIPTQLEMATFGQVVDLGQVLQMTDDRPAQRIRALAIFLYPIWSGLPYDSEAVEGFEAICAEVIMAEAVPISDFFLRSTTASAALTPPGSKTSPSAPSSSRPGPKSSRRAGRRWPSWMP